MSLLGTFRPFASTLILCVWSSFVYASETFSPDDPYICYSGTAFPQFDEGGAELLRFAPELLSEAKPQTHGFNPEKARTTAGVSMRFATDGPVVELLFDDKGSQYAVHENGVFKRSLRSDKSGRLEFVSEQPGEIVEYEIVFPIWTNPIFRKLELPEGGKLHPVTRKERPVVATIGDSITHGRGQSLGNQTWGWIAAESVGAQYYNLAIGGSNANRFQAEAVQAIPRLDLCSILWGYNDWVNRGKSVEQYVSDMNEAIDVVREVHPNTKIVVMNLLNTKTTISKRTQDQFSADDFRGAIREIVQARKRAGDDKIYFVDSQSMTDLDDLRDTVHLSVEGARKLGKAMGIEFARILD